MNKAILGCAALLAVPAFAADHLDSPADDTAIGANVDITDLFAWTDSTATKMNLALNVSPTGAVTSFSDAAQYVFNIDSMAGYGMPSTPAQVICEFDASQDISCWGGGQYVTGDASTTDGITSAEGGLKVFAGLRDDPFFMEFQGFLDATAAATSVLDGAGQAIDGTCPALTPEQSTLLVENLTGTEDDGMGNPTSPVDFFAGLNVMSIVVQIDTDLINTGGPVLAVSAGTYVK